MGRASELIYLLRATGSNIIRLRAPGFRGRRAARLRQYLTRFFAEGWRLVRRRTDVVVVSWPKSGRTWLRYMLDRLGLHLEFTHQRETRPLPGDWQRKRIIFLHRDPRDTTLSHWFAATRRGGGYTGSLSEFLRDPDAGLERAMRFNLFWKDALDRGGGLILTYEGLQADTAGELRRVVAFLGGATVGRDALDRAVAAGSFENMRALEASGRGARLYGDVLEPGDPADPDSFKTRAGRVGAWRDAFDAADAACADALLERHDYFRRMSALVSAAPS